MDSEPDPLLMPGDFCMGCPTWGQLIYVADYTNVTVSGVFILILLCCSALVSGSEVAYFGLTDNDLDELRKESEQSGAARDVLELYSNPPYLLATILIVNNFINICIIMLSAIAFEPFEQLTGSIANENLRELANFGLTTVAVTFFLVLFGEVSPKVYAQANRLPLSKSMSWILLRLRWLFHPLSSLLVKSSQYLENRLANNNASQYSADEIDQAIELTVMQEEDSKQEVDILKSILQFNHIMAKQIMRPAVDVKFLDEGMDYHKVLELVKNWGFSRVPVYRGNIDDIIGILHVKDLLKHHRERPDFNWWKLIHRDTVFVPETRKITELLNDFKKEKVHLGIVVDEWGDTQGIVTMEDIMEEIIGDIKDEFDVIREVEYQRINTHTYVFDGKTMLHDFCKILDLDSAFLEGIRGEADSLGGLVLEHLGLIPQKGQTFLYEGYRFEVAAASPKRVRKVKVCLPNHPGQGRGTSPVP